MLCHHFSFVHLWDVVIAESTGQKDSVLEESYDCNISFLSSWVERHWKNHKCFTRIQLSLSQLGCYIYDFHMQRLVSRLACGVSHNVCKLFFTGVDMLICCRKKKVL